ncbi:hypothetical protein BV20DRAFT_274068 [Pilatotrama ljubarskyi]|nr:hypothetical protein BV20DRAFT_274068 [Pilatotrama ljubarskyi]
MQISNQRCACPSCTLHRKETALVPRRKSPITARIQFANMRQLLDARLLPTFPCLPSLSFPLGLNGPRRSLQLLRGPAPSGLECAAQHGTCMHAHASVWISSRRLLRSSPLWSITMCTGTDLTRHQGALHTTCRRYQSQVHAVLLHDMPSLSPPRAGFWPSPTLMDGAKEGKTDDSLKRDPIF